MDVNEGKSYLESGLPGEAWQRSTIPLTQMRVARSERRHRRRVAHGEKDGVGKALEGEHGYLDGWRNLKEIASRDVSLYTTRLYVLIPSWDRGTGRRHRASVYTWFKGRRREWEHRNNHDVHWREARSAAFGGMFEYQTEHEDA